MSSPPLWLLNLVAWSLQVSALALAAAALARLLPVERPAVRLALLQSLLALLLALPLLQPWRESSASASATLALWTANATATGPATGGRAPWPAPWTAVAWIFGLLAAYRLARLAASLRELHALGRAARALEPEPWLRALRDEVAPRARFALSERIATPATFGLRQPLVLLPPGFASEGRDKQAALALHELLHVRRSDWLALVAEEAVVAALPFHPALRWVVRRIRLAREQLIDAAVVRRLGGRELYVESLVEGARALARAVPAAPFFHESHLRERVDLLLKEALMPSPRALRNAVLTASAILAAFALAASALPLQSPAAKAPAAAPAQPPATDRDKSAPEPKLLHKVNPVYPEDAKADKAEGKFLLDVVIDKDGAVRDARVVASSKTGQLDKSAQRGTPAALQGDPRLAKAAVEAVQAWRYEPVLKNGQPVEARMTITINFKLS